MENNSRRGLLKSTAKAATKVAMGAAGGALLAQDVQAQPAKLEKRSPYPAPNPPPARPMYSRAVAYGNMVFLSGVGAHYEGTIEQHTRTVLDELTKNLNDAGSSLQKVLKVNVYLHDLKDYDRMNAVYRSYDWGMTPPVRTTVAPAAGIPGGSLVEIDMIAYI